MAETMANVGDVERYLAEHEPVASPVGRRLPACTATRISAMIFAP